MADERDDEPTFYFDVNVRMAVKLSDRTRTGGDSWIPHPADLVGPLTRALHEVLNTGRDVNHVAEMLSTNARGARIDLPVPAVTSVEVHDAAGSCLVVWDSTGGLDED